MALLGLLELVLSFAIIRALPQAPDSVAGAQAAIARLPYGGADITAFATLTLGLIGLTIGLYRRDVCQDRTRLIAAAVLATGTAFGVLMLLSRSPESGFTASQATWIARMVGAWLMTVIIIRLSVSLTLGAPEGGRRVLLLGEPECVDLVHARLRSRRGRGFEPVTLHAQELTWPLLREARIWGVVLASPLAEGRINPVLECKMRGLLVIGSAAFHERHLGRIDLDSLTAHDLLASDGFRSNRISAAVKRGFDIVFSVIMIALTLPLMALTVLAIKADSPGPILYRQQRIGVFGRPFTVIKFRSMTADAEAGGKPRWAQKEDPRITRVGRFIRATRIDELPQLYNVIAGDMSLVGPRPERPLFVEQLTQAIPFYHQRSYVKPGLTGWAQVNYPYGASVEDAREKLAYDLFYAKHQSFWLDARILLATVRVVLFREGAR